jgi:sugar/nucleoside kinase (ribokinase family)
MSILVVGSIALDTVETPHGKIDEALGGSALYFCHAASVFAPVNIVGVVGEDFDFNRIAYLKKCGCDFDGMTVEKGLTFRWGGRYHKNVNKRDTLFTHLNVFENFKPVIPQKYKDSELIFLANIDPDLQLDVLNQVNRPRLIVLDTMNFWIHGKRDSLMDLIPRVDVMILNDEELADLTGKTNIYEGGKLLLSMGLKAVVIKKGQHGSVMMDDKGQFLAPAYPVEKVIDPTGAGDTFAGGFMGFLATCETIDDMAFRHAVIYGTIAASFVVEGFSFECLKEISRSAFDARFEALKQMTHF